MLATVPRIAVTTGEPAGVGPDLVVQLAQREVDAELVALGAPELLAARAERLGLALRLREFAPLGARRRHAPGTLAVLPVPLPAPVEPGRLDARNAPYVLNQLDRGCEGCLGGLFDALVTAPVHKGLINDAGHAFTGQTEYLAERSGAPRPVMMLAAGDFRVALATTHLPLREVCARLTRSLLAEVLTVLDRDLRQRFGIAAPRIAVCGLNPHAGEGGHLGSEEGEVLLPVLSALRQAGMNLTGPLPADTAFTPARRAETDAFLAMYHDQGLPALKAVAFSAAVNVTLGLPIIRTSVDHGTALELAGTRRARVDSLLAATQLALSLAQRTRWE